MNKSVDLAAGVSAPVEIFISYSHKDASLMAQLQDALSPLRREGTSVTWDDRHIDPGEKWGDKINQQLNSANIILLLISAGFIASDYCFTIELQRAMQRQEAHEAEVVPVIVKQCDWKYLPFARLQVLPKNAVPVTLWDDRDSAWTSVAEGVRRVTKSVIQKPRALRESAVLAPEARVANVRVWNVPHNRNRNFTGRGTLLGALHQALSNGGLAALTQVLTGLGGVGKTQTAIEYVYRYSADYDLVWWIRSQEPAKLASDYAALAKPLGLKEDQDLTVTIAAVKSEIARRGRWLLVFDNANKVDDVRDYLPQTDRGHILITSRDPNWSEVAALVKITTWPRDESVRFLLKRTGHSDEASAAGLAEAVGDLPLALEQASAYIEASGCSLADYLRILRNRTREILRNKQAPAGYHATVATTWELAFVEVEKESQPAAQLMNLCAFLAPEDIWREMLMAGPQHLPEPLAGVIADDSRWNEALAALRRYSLVEVQAGALSVHRLVQAVVRERLDASGKKNWATAAVNVMKETFPYQGNDIKTWAPSARSLPHALVSAEYAEGLHVALEPTGRLLEQVGRYLLRRAKFASAKSVLARAQTIDEAVYGPDHPNVARDMSNLGEVLKQLGELAGARACYERALKIDEAVYGPDHPNVATDVSYLGDVLRDQGDATRARVHFERALKIYESAYGRDHPNIARVVTNLGDVLLEQEDLAEAQAHYERALKIDEAAYGPDHPDVATDLNSLGYVLQEQGNLAEARGHLERALKIDEEVYGPDHPKVARDVNDLGLVRQQEGDLTAAWLQYTRALKIDEETYGPYHANVARDVSNIGTVLRQQRDLAGARKQFERTLKINETVYGQDHPKVAMCVWWLAVVFQETGDILQARAHFERALTIFESSLGQDHPKTQSVRESLANLGAQ